MKKRFIAFLMAVCMTSSLAFSGGVTVSADEGAIVAEDTQQKVSFTSEYPSLGQPLSVEVIGLTGTLTYKWEVGGNIRNTNGSYTERGSGATYTPTKDDLEKFIRVSVKDQAGTSLTAQVFFSKLPVVYVNTENSAEITSKEEYLNADLVIQGNEVYNSATTTLYDGKTEIRGRGNSTWGLPKKPYKLKLDKKADLFGFGESKHWVLLANYYDTSFLRNKLSYDLSGDLGVPYMQSVLTDVVLNGQYIGNYQFCEQIKVSPDRVDIFNWEDAAEDAADAIADASGFAKADKKALESQMAEDYTWVTSGTVQYKNVDYEVAQYYDVPEIDGGYLIEMDENFDELSEFKTQSGQPIMIKEPEYAAPKPNEYADSPETPMLLYVKEYLQAFENAVSSPDYNAEYKGETKHYTELFDMDSLVDNWLVQEIFFNTDFMKKSTYMYKAHGELFKMGPIWDMDWSSGNTQVSNKELSRYNQWQTWFFNNNAQANQWYKSIVGDPYFLRKAHSRYWEVRDSYIQDMLNSIDTISAEISESAEASLRAWNLENYNTALVRFKEWMTNRIDWMDSKMASYAIFEGEFAKQYTSYNMQVTLEDGSSLAADTVSRKEAAFDALAQKGQALKVALNGLGGAGKVEFRVNGEKKGESAVTNGNASFTIPNVTEDSVIQAYVYNYNSLAGTADLAVKVTGEEIPPAETLVEIDHTTLMKNAKASSQQDPAEDNDGPAEYAFNGVDGNWWHSLWKDDVSKSGEVSADNPIWIGTGFDSVQKIKKVTYQGRNDTGHNLIGEYELKVANLSDPKGTPSDADFRTVKSGSLEATKAEQEIVLDDAVEATHIRLVAKSHLSVDNTSDAHVAAMHIKVYALGSGGGTTTPVDPNPPAEEKTTISFTSDYPEIGKALGVEVAGITGTLSYKWEVDGTVKGTEASYTPAAADLEKFIKVTVSGTDGTSASIQKFFSKLPVLYIDTENGVSITSKDDYVDAQFIMQGNAQYNKDTTTLYEGATQIRGRGNTTWGLPKKPYKLKLNKSTNILGFGKSKHWVLLANYYDTTYLRNKLSYDLSGALGIPYMQSILTDVVLNGEYVGNYQFCEQIKISKDRVNITNWEDEAEDAAAAIAEAEGLNDDVLGDLESLMAEDYTWVTTGYVKLNEKQYQLPEGYKLPELDGGYLLEMDENYDEVSKFLTAGGQPMMFKEPEFANSSNEMMTYVADYIQAFENAVNSEDFSAVYNDEKKHYSELFDMDSLVDNWIVQEIFFNEDFMKKSSYMYKASGELFKMGPIWDMDWSSGASQSAAKSYNQWQTIYFSNNAQQSQWYKRLVQDPYFLRAVHSRYWEIRNTHIQDMLDSIDTISAQVSESANASLKVWDQLKTNAGGPWNDPWDSRPSSYEEAVDTFKEWMTNRIEWLDSKMKTYAAFEKEFIKSSTTFDMKVTYADGTELEKDTLSPEQAEFDAKAQAGETLKVQAAGIDKAVKAQLLVNGNNAGEAEVKNGSVEFSLDGLKEDSIIQIYAYTADGDLVGVSSMAIKVEGTVEPTLQSIAVTTLPNKTTYKLNEALDLTGLVVTAFYSDGTKKAIPIEDLEVEGYDASVPGEQVLRVLYEGMSDELVVLVEEEEEREIPLESISLNVEETEMLLRTTLDLTVTYNPENTTVSRTVKWTSSDEKIAAVDENGKVKALWPGKVTITASVGTLEARCQITVAGTEKIYDDVHTDDWYYNAANWTYVNEIMTGLNATTFGPDSSLVRAQFAVILYRLAGSPEVDDTQTSFPDVEADMNNSWYKKAVIWANENRIITGYTNSGFFGANDNITREQMATILYRYLVSLGPIPDNTGTDMPVFPDAGQIQGFAKEAMSWAVTAELIKGDQGYLKPQGNANRAEAATIIWRFSDTYLK